MDSDSGDISKNVSYKSKRAYLDAHQPQNTPVGLRIQDLPVEIFEMVLLEWEKHYHSDMNAWFNDLTYYGSLFALRGVSRSTIDGAPRLWRFINRVCYHPNARKLILKNSRQVPLKVEAHLDVRLKPEISGVKAREEFVRDICAVSHRWKTLHFRAPSTLDDPLVRQVLSAYAPCLVSFNNDPHAGMEDESLPFQLFGGSATKLRTITFPCQSISDSFAAFPNLTSIDYNNVPRSWCPKSGQELHEQWVLACPLLKKVTTPASFCGALNWEQPRFYGTIQPPALERLVVRGATSTWLRLLLERIDAPNAKYELQFYGVDRPSVFAAVRQFSQRIQDAQMTTLRDCDTPTTLERIAGIRFCIGGIKYPEGELHIANAFHGRLYWPILRAILFDLLPTGRASLKTVQVEQRWKYSLVVAHTLEKWLVDLVPGATVMYRGRGLVPVEYHMVIPRHPTSSSSTLPMTIDFDPVRL